MSRFNVKIENVSKIFGRRLIFKNINIELNNSGIYGIAGPNGSGKSTFVKIAAGLISPTNGKVIHSINQTKISQEKLHNYLGFVSPYLILYEEFSAEENIHFFSKIRGIKLDYKKADYLFEKFSLLDRKKDKVKTFSSGMKQRLKFIFALIHSPEMIILDEPTSNLDNIGKEEAYKLIKTELENKIILIASNEDSDLEICSSILNLNEFKK